MSTYQISDTFDDVVAQWMLDSNVDPENLRLDVVDDPTFGAIIQLTDPISGKSMTAPAESVGLG